MSQRENQRNQFCRRKRCEQQEATISPTTVPGRPAPCAGLRCAKRTVENEKWVEEKASFLHRPLFRFLLPRNSPGDIIQTRRSKFGLSPTPFAGWGPGGTEPKRPLYPMKRGAVLNRSYCALGFTVTVQVTVTRVSSKGLKSGVISQVCTQSCKV